MKVTGLIAYVSQESWLFSSTLRENVLFGLPYKKDWYDTVINVCALDKVCLRFLNYIVFDINCIDGL